MLSALLLTGASPKTPMVMDPQLDAIPGFRSPSTKDVNHAIFLAIEYLEKTCGPDGRFVYRVNTLTGQQSPSYNILRHAGTIYSLEMADREHPDQRLTETIVRSGEFLQHYVAPVRGSDMLAVWSSPANQTKAELGASGLGLVALTAVREHRPDMVSLAELQAIGHFILSMQKADGSFVMRFSAVEGMNSHAESLYYPGEATLGLLALYGADPSPLWLDGAGRALMYLAQSRANIVDVPADHWVLISTDRLLTVCEHVKCPVKKQDLINQSRQICESILKEEVSTGTYSGRDGSFGAVPRTTPAATRLEGLLAARHIGVGQDLQERIRVAATHGVAFLLRSQITSGPYAGGVLGLSQIQYSDNADVRVDYLQHSLSAWLRYRDTYSTHPR